MQNLPEILRGVLPQSHILPKPGNRYVWQYLFVRTWFISDTHVGVGKLMDSDGGDRKLHYSLLFKCAVSDRIWHGTYMSHAWDIFGRIQHNCLNVPYTFVQFSIKCLTVYVTQLHNKPNQSLSSSSSSSSLAAAVT